MPGLEHLPFAEVWFHEIDDARWREASAAARAIGKSGLEVWTTDRTPEVAGFLEARGYDVVRRYVISELDVAAAPEPAPPQFELTTFAERPDLVRALFEIARESYPDQPGRSEQRMESFEEWRSWGLDPHPAETYFIALEDARAIGYGFLDFEEGTWSHGFTAVSRAARGCGVASAIKSAQTRLGKGERRASAAHGERGASRRHARDEQAPRLSAVVHGARAPWTGRAGTPSGIRTRATGVKGRRPRPLDDGGRGRRRIAARPECTRGRVALERRGIAPLAAPPTRAADAAPRAARGCGRERRSGGSAPLSRAVRVQRAAAPSRGGAARRVGTGTRRSLMP